MTSFSDDLRRVLVGHIREAEPHELIDIAASICEDEEPFPGISASETAVQIPAAAEMPRFVVEGDVVTDRTTGLMWMRETLPGGRRKWADAKKAAAEVSIGGHTDWRLPTIQELLTLVDYARTEPAIDPAFKCESAWYWTDTQYASSPSGYAWYVFFGNGHSSWGHQNYEGFVRAVRPGQSVGNLD